MQHVKYDVSSFHESPKVALSKISLLFNSVASATFQPVLTLGGISAHSDVSPSVAEGMRCNLNAISRASKL